MAILDQRYTINGLIRTDQPIWENLQSMAEASGCWLTYDTYTGQYAVIINQVGDPVETWTENDIIGSIAISGSGLTNLYNAIEIEYPSVDIRDQPNYARLSLPSSLRNAYEPDNTLQISNDLINNDVQAQLIANITLRQARLDKSVTIRTDFTKIGRRAGDIIAITSDTYGWTAKEFRIMRVREIEGDDGSLQLEFLASEYDDSVYDEGDLNDFLKGGTPGIRSITAIGVPGTPTVESITVDSLPAQRVSTTVPEGIVERMQFWAANVDVTGNVANSTFQLYGSLASPDAAAWTANATATFTTTALRDGTWAWKTRGINALGVGPFSDASGNVDFVRKQTPDVVKIDTPIVDSAGNVFANAKAMISVAAGVLSDQIIAQSANISDFKSVGNTGNFQVPVTGNYKFDILFDTNSSGARGGRGALFSENEDVLQGKGELINISTGNSVIASENSGGTGALSWSDFVLTGLVTLNAGNVYKIDFTYLNYTESNPTANANVTVGWNVYSVPS